MGLRFPGAAGSTAVISLDRGALQNHRPTLADSRPAPPPRRRNRRASIALILLAAAVGAGCAGQLCLRQCFGRIVFAGSGEQTAKTAPPGAGKAGDDGYVGSEVCAGCHSEISSKFERTAMGRSMSPAGPEFLKTLPLPSAVDDPKAGLHFEVFSRDGKLFQTESQAGKDGAEVFRETHEIEWIVGAGTNGLGGLIDRGGYLFQGPLSYYSRAQSWDLSPGYEFFDYGFNRPILAGCIGCHSGRARPVPATNGRYEEPPFAQAAIGCENCHGPGRAHAAAMRAGKRLPASQHNAIVNPAKLSPQLANDICMSCHQTGDLRIFKPGKSYADFRPGKPLDETLAILMAPPKRESPPDADHLEHYYSMTLSKCFRASAGRLACINCHDPHVEPGREEAPAYFAKKCLTCHSESSCKAPREARLRTTPSDDCIGCHMPKREVRTIQHASITNHRILASPGEGFPDSAFERTTPALPDLIHLNPAAGAEKAAPPDLTLLQAYGELLETKPEYAGQYSALLGRMEKTEPDAVLVQAALGRRELRAGRYEEAMTHLRRAIEIGPPQATTYGDLAEAMIKLNRPEEGLAWQQKAVALDPFNPLPQKAEIVSYIHLKQYANARAALEHYLQVFPQDTFMRHMLEMATAGAGGQ